MKNRPCGPSGVMVEHGPARHAAGDPWKNHMDNETKETETGKKLHRSLWLVLMEMDR